MCCFSRPVQLVANTKIFARASQENRQFLVYSMRVSANEDLAMILPLPVPNNPAEDAVRFINLEKYADFFKDMATGFPVPVPKSAPIGNAPRAPATAPTLRVVEVGSFEASFVPTVRDFNRLDERFRLPAAVWDRLPQYQNFGFAVFKLKMGTKDIHPMAFEFPRADPKQLFFPTVHIHDGQVRTRAGFDHALYCQGDSVKMTMGWRESIQPAGMFMKMDKVQGILTADKHCYLKTMRGSLTNEDILV